MDNPANQDRELDQATLNKFYRLIEAFAEDYKTKPWPDLYDLYDDRLQALIQSERQEVVEEFANKAYKELDRGFTKPLMMSQRARISEIFEAKLKSLKGKGE